MESDLDRLAREITVMRACGGPLSRRDWIAHIADQLNAVEPSARELAPLSRLFEGDRCRARRFLAGLEISCASFVSLPEAVDWQPGGRAYRLLELGLAAIAEAISSPLTNRSGKRERVQSVCERPGHTSTLVKPP